MRNRRWRQQDLLKPRVPAPARGLAHQGFFAQSGQRLEWRTELPLVVLSHGRTRPTPGLSDEQSEAWERTWRELQQDLAMRSARGQFRIADKSAHFIQIDQPDVVIQAIRDVSQTR
jgi:pimeloyl-ACP methyl ester carboxylesterase